MPKFPNHGILGIRKRGGGKITTLRTLSDIKKASES